MTRLRTAGLLFGLPLAALLCASSAQAQEGESTVTKTPPAPAPAAPAPAAPPEAAPAPAGGAAAPKQAPASPLGGQTNEAEAPVNEMVPATIDEGAGWEAAVEAAQAAKPLIGEAQAEAVSRINDYFNAITNLQGHFEQVDSTNKASSGRFYVQRPGKIRFDYAPPSALRIVADGSHLAIEDSDLKTVEKYPIKATPFRLLLSDSVDLERDARIVGVESDEDTLAITLEDKSGEAAGAIKLVFKSGDELQLREWIITDAQGLTTRVTIRDTVSGRKVAADFFNSKEGFQPFR